jgi:hypothetical protein
MRLVSIVKAPQRTEAPEAFSLLAFPRNESMPARFAVGLNWLWRVVFEGLSQGSLNAPSVLKPEMHCALGKSNRPSPLGQRHGPAVEGNQSVQSSVPALLFCSGPSDVSRFVVSVVVDALKGVIHGRPRTHVSHEVGEAIPPTGAHVDAPSSVVAITGRVGIVTPGTHTAPAGVFGRKFSSLCKAVCNFASAKNVTKPDLTRAATTIASALMALDVYRLLCSAFAAAEKLAPGHPFQHGPSAVRVSGPVDQCWHVEPPFYRNSARLAKQIRACGA